MKIIGKELAMEVYESIHKKLLLLNKKQIIPRLVIVKSMNIDAVNNYIHQKVKKGKKVGITVDVVEFSEDDFKNINKIKKTISKLNCSSTVNGIIFQKPGHKLINEEMEKYIDLSKDVDGFLKGSHHKPPVYRGVIQVLGAIFKLSGSQLITRLKKKKIVLIGKGKTGGGTVISGLKQDGFNTNLLTIIDSKSTMQEKKEYCHSADIIISAVGKQNPVDFHWFSKKTILIDIGVHFDDANKIKGDFNEVDIKDRVAYYTTTPGGLGALTVAYLMDNTVNTALKTIIN